MLGTAHMHCTFMSAAAAAADAAAASPDGRVDDAVHVTAIMASATRALAIEKFGINGQGRGVIDRFIAGDAAISTAAASVSSARLARMALRTWIVDRWLLNVSRSCTQVVLMGAGLDTRCFSLPLPHETRVFELDLPVVISMKSHLLASWVSPCQLFHVPCDLSHPSWAELLRHAGFHQQRTVWLCEGLTMYLRSDAVAAMLRRMRELSSQGSHLLLHAMPPPHPDEVSGAHVPYEFSASAAECSALLQEIGWTPAPAITYASALADVQLDPTLEAHAVRGICSALFAASSGCDSLSADFAPYFIPACI